MNYLPVASRESVQESLGFSPDELMFGGTPDSKGEVPEACLQDRLC